MLSGGELSHLLHAVSHLIHGLFHQLCIVVSILRGILVFVNLWYDLQRIGLERVLIHLVSGQAFATSYFKSSFHAHVGYFGVLK